LIFPEIDYAKVDKTKGMNISITTTAETDAKGWPCCATWGCRSGSNRKEEERWLQPRKSPRIESWKRP